MFSKDIYLKRQECLCKRLNAYNIRSLLIIDPVNRLYFSGFTGTAGWLLFTPHENFIVTDFRYSEQVHDEAAGFTPVISTKNFVFEVISLIRKLKIKSIWFDPKYTTVKMLNDLNVESSDIEWIPLSMPIDDIRMIKNSEEIDIINEACKYLKTIVESIYRMNLIGMTEQELVMVINCNIRSIWGFEPAFPIIVLSGVNASRPHGKPGDKRIEKNEMILIDLGVCLKGYHTDLTRTFVVGSADEKFLNIYDIVSRAQKKAIENILSGKKCSDIHRIAQNVIDKDGFGKYFGHGLGHGVGLEIHEGPVMNAGSETVLMPDMIVTVEPGIYIPGWGGVRIEDMVRVTSSGCDVLTEIPYSPRVWSD